MPRVYLLSDLSRSVTGEIHHVDAGYHIVGMKHPDAPDIGVARIRTSPRHSMSVPTLYYVRHGETDWNLRRPAAGPARHPAQCDRGRAQARHCGDILRDLFARDGRAATDFDYVSSPLGRARETMEIVRTALGLDPAAIASTAAARSHSANGKASPIEEVLQRDQTWSTRASTTNGCSRPPGGETYEDVARRVRDWYATLDRDTVATAHGGTARALIVHLGIAPPEEAAHQPIEQGVRLRVRGSQRSRGMREVQPPAI